MTCYTGFTILLTSSSPSHPHPPCPGDTPESSDSGLAAAAPDVQVAAELSSAQEEQLSQVMSGLRLENQLLRSEVSSLNQEMASLVQRAKDTQEGTRTPTLLYFIYRHMNTGH